MKEKAITDHLSNHLHHIIIFILLLFYKLNREDNTRNQFYIDKVNWQAEDRVPTKVESKLKDTTSVILTGYYSLAGGENLILSA